MKSKKSDLKIKKPKILKTKLLCFFNNFKEPRFYKWVSTALVVIQADNIIIFEMKVI